MIEIGKWKKGSRSNGTGGNNCVEVTMSDGGGVFVRCSRNPGVTVGFSPAEWTAFIESVQLGEFSLPGGGTGGGEGSAGAGGSA